jgi:hypothetical protein
MTLDQFAKILSMLSAVAVGVGAIVTYYDTANRELQKPFNDIQLSLCKDASETAATIASLQPLSSPAPLSADGLKEPLHQARMRFEQLYWGSLAIVENTDVEQKMVDFRKGVLALETPAIESKREGQLPGSLHVKALDLAHACRDLVSKTWQLSLPILVGKKD